MAIEWSTRASSSMAMHSAVKSPPEPPYSSGNGSPNRPSLPIASTTWTGKWCSRSHASAYGAISDWAKSRTTARSASCSAVMSTSRQPYAALVGSLDQPPVASVGGRLATGLLDVTSDVSALDGSGFWVVVLPYDGEPVCARFERTRPTFGRPRRSWIGPQRGAWRSSLDRDGFTGGVATIRASIAAGDVYQVNLTRRLSAPLPRDADVLALANALAG